MSAELVSTLGLLLCLAPAAVHGVEVISPMLSRWVVNLVLPFFGPGVPAANAALSHDEQLVMLDAARAASPDGKQAAADNYLFLLLFEQRQGSLAFLSVAVGVVYGLGLGLDARAPLHLVFGVMSVLFALVNANHAGIPGLGRHPRVSRHGRNVGILFAPFWAASAAFNLMAFDGASERCTKMSTKETVEAFLGAAMSNEPATMRKLANADYIQHNPHIPTGLEPFIGMLPVLQQHGTTAENVRMFQDGNYVFMHNIWRNAKPFGADEMVAFDIIRVDDDGKVAEHWDALTPLVKQTASGRTQTDGSVKATDLDKTEANKALAKAMVEDLLMGKNPSKMPDYISSERYHQHNPHIKDGLAGLVEAVEQLVSQNNMFKYTKIHKVLGEGDFVLVVSEGQWNGSVNAFYDLLRFENGKAVEHWDVIQPAPTENLANSNTMFGF